MAKFGPDVTGGELPIAGPLIDLSGLFPVAELVVECIDVRDPSKKYSRQRVQSPDSAIPTVSSVSIP